MKSLLTEKELTNKIEFFINKGVCSIGIGEILAPTEFYVLYVYCDGKFGRKFLRKLLEPYVNVKVKNLGQVEVVDFTL